MASTSQGASLDLAHNSASVKMEPTSGYTTSTTISPTLTEKHEVVLINKKNIAIVTLPNHDLVSTTNYINPTTISDYETN